MNYFRSMAKMVEQMNEQERLLFENDVYLIWIKLSKLNINNSAYLICKTTIDLCNYTKKDFEKLKAFW